MAKRPTFFAALALAGVLCACGGTTTSSDEPSEVPTSADKPEKVRCLKVPNALSRRIANAAVGTNMKPTKAKAVKSPDVEVYFVAIRFHATGVSNLVGVWATNSLDPGSTQFLTVDNWAEKLTPNFPDASGANAAVDDPSALAAKACLCTSATDIRRAAARRGSSIETRRAGTDTVQALDSLHRRACQQ